MEACSRRGPPAHPAAHLRWTPWASSAGPPASGSLVPSPSRRPPSRAPGKPSPRVRTPWLLPPPAPERRSPPSCGRWTGCWFPERRWPPNSRARGFFRGQTAQGQTAEAENPRTVHFAAQGAWRHVERNLRSPLIGITQTAKRLDLPAPLITVGVRSGDTPASDRRALLSNPPDILITTPESLFLMLTSKARETLSEVDTIIVDEVHAVAGTKRGAHLAVSLERLDALLPTPAQRIGLSRHSRATGARGAVPGRLRPGGDRGTPFPQELGPHSVSPGGGHV